MNKLLKALVSIMLIFRQDAPAKTVEKASNSTKRIFCNNFDGNYYNMINNGRSKNTYTELLYLTP